MGRIRRSLRQQLASLLSAVMAVSSVFGCLTPLTAYGAAGSSGAAYTVESVKALDGDIARQELDTGCSEEEIEFPDTLTVYLDMDELRESTATASNASGSNATRSNSEYSADESEKESLGDGDVLNEATAFETEVSVSWELDPKDSAGEAFDGGRDGSVWYYDPVLSGFDEEGRELFIPSGLELPYITVLVGDVEGDAERGGSISRGRPVLMMDRMAAFKSAGLNSVSYVENDLFLSMKAIDGVISAPSGDVMGVEALAYNDNPNAEAAAEIRIKADFGSREKALLVGSGEGGVGFEDITLEIADMNGSEFENGGSATSVEIASWTEPDENGVRYLEFTLPAGASVGFEFRMSSLVGHDHTIDAKISAEYRIADENGEFPDDFESGDSLVLTWLGKFSWGGFEKTAEPETFDYVGGAFSGDAVIRYAFTAVNEAGTYSPDGPGYGPIYTEKVVLKDDITLPDGMVFPAGMIVSEDGKGITLADGTTPVVTVTGLEDGADFTLEATPSDAAGKGSLSFILTINNADPDSAPATWNPLENGALGADLSLGALTVAAASMDWTGAKITNDADFTAYSVVQNEGTDDEKQETYHETGSAETALTVTDNILFDKEIARITKRGSSTPVEYYNDGTSVTPEVGDGDTIWYTVSLTNQSFYTRDIEFTDQLPQVLHFEEASVTVNNDRKDLRTRVRVAGTGFEIEDLGTIASEYPSSPLKYKFKIKDVLPGETVYVHYVCWIDFTKMDTMWTPEGTDGYVRIENIAAMGDREEKAVVRTPKDGKLTLKKEIVSRRGQTKNGAWWEITATFDSDYNVTGYTASGAYSDQFGDRAALGWDKLVREFNAGDYIEYLITLDNGTYGDIWGGSVQDIAPFMRNMYGTSPAYTAGWQVYAYGLSENYLVSGFTSDNATMGTFGAYQSMSSNVYSENNYSAAFGSHARHFSDLVDACCGTGWDRDPRQVKFYDSQTDFSFSSNRPLKAKTKYRQSVTVRAPGNNSAPPEQWSNSSTANTINKGFHHIVTTYRYDTGMTSPGSSNLSSNSDLKAYAYWTGASGPGITTSSVTTVPIYHAVEGELFVNAGIVAQAVVKDPANIGTDELCVHAREARAEEDANKFAPVEGQVVVGSVTLFNMTSDTIWSGTTGYELGVFLPQGFEWLGFSACTMKRDENGKEVLYYGPPTETGKTYLPSSGKFGLALFDSATSSPIVNNSPITEYTGGSFYEQSLSAGTPVLYYGGGARKVPINFGSLPPNSGIMFFYAAKVNEKDLGMVTSMYDANNAATFGAILYRNSSGLIASPTVNLMVGECGAHLGSARKGLDNQGYVNSAKNYSGEFVLTGTRSSRTTKHGVLYNNSYTSGGGTTGSLPSGSMNPSKALWSYANVFPDLSKRISVSVDKEVIKNSGKDEDVDSRSIDKYDSDYDNYNFHYIPHDGIHRTVDGTVTWKVTVENTGKNNGSNIIYDSVDCGLLIDTVDSPYELQEIYIPQVIYASEPFNGTSRVSQPFFDIRIQTPPGTEFPLIWDLQTKEAVETLPEDHPGIRISAERVEDASVAWGFDAGIQAGSDQNTWATRYIVEFADYKHSSGYTLGPTLTVEGNGQFWNNDGKVLNAWLTFRTTDAIETNYNSFAAVFPDVQEDHLVISNEAVARMASDVHKENAEAAPDIDVSEEASGEAAAGTLSAGNGRLLSAPPALLGAPALRASSSRWPSEQGSSPDSTLAVEHSDWTDTSYTDGKKTITLVNADGSAVTDDEGNAVSVNSRTHGNMLLPEKASAGDKIHGELMVESILYEAEHYGWYDNLTIYDVYGLEEDGRCAYNVDFDSIVVTDRVDGSSSKTAPSREEASHQFVLGQDYRLYYTTTDLVTTEHHPITPVHTLQYAADIGALEDDGTEWVLYDPDSEESKKAAYEAVGFKVVLLNDYGKVSKADGEERCEIYVSYDATVRSDVKGDTRYPNVLAWSAIMQEVDEGGAPTSVRKPFIEDTTAMFVETEESRDPTITKVLKSNGYVVDTGKTFTFYVHHSAVNKPGTNNVSRHLNNNDVDAVIRVDLKAGETKKIAADGILVYNKGGYADINAVIHGGGRFWIVEKLDTGYTGGLPSQEDGSGIITGDGQVFVGYSGQGASFDSSKYEAEYFTEDADEDTLAYFDGTYYRYLPYVSVAPTETNWYVRTTFTNFYQVGGLTLKKMDSAGNPITARPVTFQLLKDDVPVIFRKGTSGGIAAFTQYSGDPNEDTSNLTTDITFTKEAKILGLLPGTYTLRETVPPEGYGVAEDQTIEVTAGMQSYTMAVSDPDSEDYVPGKLTIRKVNAGELITTGEARFKIYPDEGADADPEPAPLEFRKKTDDDSGETIPGVYVYDMTTTDSEYYSELVTEGGILELEEIPVGKYRIVETEAPDGYEAAYTAYDDGVEAEVLRSTFEGSAVINNALFSAELRITKLDEETGEPVTGNAAGFEIKATPSDADDVSEDGGAEGGTETAMVPLTFTKSTTGSYRYDEEGTETTLYTDPRTGILTVFNLPRGTYSAEETVAPDGYALDGEPQLITMDTSKPEDGDWYALSFNDRALPLTLRIHKAWKVQGVSTRYDLEGVNFRLYQKDKDSEGTASFIAEGKTDAEGRLSFEELDWSRDAWLVEEYPVGFEPGDFVEGFKVSEDGNTLYLGVGDEALQDVTAIHIPLSDKIFTMENDIPVYDREVLNIRPNTFGGYYASVAYKTIDNYETAKRTGITKQKGYSYYYTDEDYSEGNYNYVKAVDPGDTVTYTLNVANVSSYPFETLVLIDRMPESGDTGVVNHAERSSEFAVLNIGEDSDKGGMTVTVDGRTVDPSEYTVGYSGAVQYTEDDFDGSSEWAESADETTKSFRVAFADGFVLSPGSRLQVTFSGTIGDDAKPGMKAWNNFAYRYRVKPEKEQEQQRMFAAAPARSMTLLAAADDTEEAGTAGAGTDGAEDDKYSEHYVLTPEPPKVGVEIIGFEAEIEGIKSFKFGGEGEADKDRRETFAFTLKRTETEASKDSMVWDVGVAKDAAGTEDAGSAPETELLAEEGKTVEAETALGDTADFAFPKLYFTHTGVYTFDVAEVIPEGAEKDEESGLYVKDGVSYSDEVWHVTVDCTSVKMDGDDVVYVPVDPEYKSESGNNGAAAVFTNTYDVTEAEASVEAEKRLEGGKELTEGQFSFELYSEEDFDAAAGKPADGAEPVAGGTNGAPDDTKKKAKVELAAETESGRFTYTKPGTYTYYMVETIPDDAVEVDGVWMLDNIYYTDKVVKVTVDVADNGKGELKAAVKYDGAETIPVFKNRYSKPGSDSVKVKAVKKLTGDTTLKERQFKFVLYKAEDCDASGVPEEGAEPVMTAESGKPDGNTAEVFFDEGTGITFSYDEPAEESFWMFEATPANAVLQDDGTWMLDDITYSADVVKVTVKVTDTGTGTLAAELKYDGGTEAPTFTNAYKQPDTPDKPDHHGGGGGGGGGSRRPGTPPGGPGVPPETPRIPEGPGGSEVPEAMIGRLPKTGDVRKAIWLLLLLALGVFGFGYYEEKKRKQSGKEA